MTSAKVQAAMVRAGEVSARGLTEKALRHIEADNGVLNAFVEVNAHKALRQAEHIDEQVANGVDPGLLAGVPIGVKELESAAGFTKSMGSLLRKDDPPQTVDSLHVGRLRAAGAVVLGMTASPEIGSAGFTRSRAWGTTRNPWDTSRTPGGSSGGSAAAVASGMVSMSTATDGGGSTRIPAAFSGLVGMKPSHGRIPKEGASSGQTSVCGVLTTTVGDAARHLDVACGPDSRDRTSLPHPGLSYEKVVETLDVGGLRVAWSSDLGFAEVDPEVAAICEAAAITLTKEAHLSESGYKPSLEDATGVWGRSGGIDLWLNLERGEWPECGELMVPPVRKSYELTEDMKPADYARVLRSRTKLEYAVAELFEEVDILLTPATAVPAFVAEGPPPTQINGKSVHAAMAVPFTMFANMAWNPAVSVPAGMTREGLPVGIQIMGQRHCDEVVLRLARILEQSNPWPALANGWSGSN